MQQIGGGRCDRCGGLVGLMCDACGRSAGAVTRAADWWGRGARCAAYVTRATVCVCV